MASIEVLRVNRIGQITGTTADSWQLLVDPMGWPLLTDTGRWNVIGVDLGANTQHSDGRTYIFFGDVATDQSGNPPENADLVAWFDEQTPLRNGGHLAMGWNFQLPITGPGIHGQPDWQFCLKCSSLFWNGDLHFKGRCSAGDTHNTFGFGLNFSLPFEPTTIPGQDRWRFCGNCASLFWTDNEGKTGTCPVGGSHVAAGWRFVVPVTPGTQGGQPDWRFCASCHGLFWDGFPSKGICKGSPGGGVHLHAVTQNRDPNGRFDGFRAPEPIGYTGPLETPNGAFSLDNRMYVFAGFADEKWSRIRRAGDPQPGLYLFSKSDPAAPGPYDVEFMVSPKLGWCARDESRLVFESHVPLGFRFLLPHDLPDAPSRLKGWRCCRKCEAVFFAGDETANGVCQRGGPHEVDTSVPGDFTLELGLPEDIQNQSNWKLCGKCMALFWSIEGEDPGLCPANGQHESIGNLFRIPHISIQPDGAHQPDWRFCRKCYSLFWDGDPNVRSVCPKDNDRHERAGFNFLLPFLPGEFTNSPPHWRFCWKCAALFFEGEPSACPSGHGPHEAAGWRFPLMQDIPESLERQANWRRCRKCSGLYFDGYPDNGCCPSDGLGHEREFIGPDFVLEHNPGVDGNTRGGFKFCVRCHGLVRNDQPVEYPWLAPVLVNNAEHPVLPSNVVQGVVMIGFDWRNFRLSWMPLTSGVRPRFDSFRYYHAGKGTWSDTIDSSPGYEIFSHPLPGQYTHVSATWLTGPRCWIVLFSAAWDITKEFTRPILARFSHDLVRWSAEVCVFDPIREEAYGVYMHDPGRDRIHPDLPPAQPNNQDNKGWAYGAFILDKFTKWDDTTRTLHLTYLLSLGSPYQVQMMETLLRLPEPVV